ncbi:aminodeoxychorismate synthase component I [Lysinibacillus yapensis]|uniref:Aminodeoxychorismate synthase component I n=1 Tax=Ureibacillus yapensis TaxID=2304605 RepID=A0A396SB18_9BACL|nr:aminodeoxychorismate synthase component I [Lysinibacillus yapensis]RHW38293.1 aminodeoxychorismate synthase component I [Lysinibacillus yapensis]
MNKIKEPFLSFEFAGEDGKIHPLAFRDPLKIIIAHKIEDVYPSFMQIQQAVKDGYYAAGFVSYESAPAFDPAFEVNNQPTMPLVWFGIFSEPVGQTFMSEGQYELSDWQPNTSIAEYEAAIETIKSQIKNGNTYQTNYTIRLSSHFSGDDLAFFNSLKTAQSSNYCSYINTGDFSVLSASPELFFHLKDDRITTRPMKGTIARGKTLEEDEEHAKWLSNSEKNQAENVMIVDLLRNDLSMIAKQGTVKVPKLFQIEHYPTVHQMTSTITAEVKPDTALFDVFKALFPCGSITGAPKISTMQLIANIETAPRDVYCGAIGYITPEHEAIFNVPIRTVLINHQTGQATYGVGGGITWDSTSNDEYNEVLTKAKLLKKKKPAFHLLESILLTQGKFEFLEEHLNRMEKSSVYFNFRFDREKVKHLLLDFCKSQKTGDYKVRLQLSEFGEVMMEAQPLHQPNTVTVKLADSPIDKENLFLYHKTTNRDLYFQFQQPDVFDVLLWNENQELTEFTNGNVVLELDGKLYTPPIKCGLLAGTFREILLKNGTIQVKVLTLRDLAACSHIWFINSVRKWIKVELL